MCLAVNHCSLGPLRLVHYKPLVSKSNSLTCALQTDESGTTVRGGESCRVKLQTLKGCKLGIGRYPDFEYNAGGGGGNGIATPHNFNGDDDGRVDVRFDAESLYIPPLTYQTTKFLGLPLPPFLSIDIVPDTLQGFMEPRTGKVELNFRANFYFSILSLYKPPPLLVETILTTEEVKGELRNGRGQRLNLEGCCKLVGVTIVIPVDDFFFNIFLNLPTECLANMFAKIIIVN